MTTLVGSGTLRVDGEDAGKIAFQITVTTSGAMRKATGSFRAEPEAFILATTARETTIVRDDNGFEMMVVLTKISADGSGTLAVSGSPGPIG